MKRYYVNDNAQEDSDDHEVHDEDCTFCPDPENRTDLGRFSSCEPAVREAKKYYSDVNGCFYCSLDCHTT